MAQPKALTHMAYGCDGVTGKGSKMKVFPCSFQKLFQSLFESGLRSGSWTQNETKQMQIDYILIPLLQRTYCWSDIQIQTWWRDANGKSPHVNADINGKHGTGKCMFKLADSDGVPLPATVVLTDSSSSNSSSVDGDKPGKSAQTTSTASALMSADATIDTAPGRCLLCIDGQQRITTQTLLYAAVRDCLLKLLFELQCDMMLVANEIDDCDVATESLLSVSPALESEPGYIDGAIDSTTDTNTHPPCVHAGERAAWRQLNKRIKSIILPLTQLIDELEKLLFSGRFVQPMLKYIQNCVDKVQQVEKEEHIFATRSSSAAATTAENVQASDINRNSKFIHTNPLGLKEGQPLPFNGYATLLPSYVDRAPYFELLLIGRFTYMQALSKLKQAVCDVANGYSSLPSDPLPSTTTSHIVSNTAPPVTTTTAIATVLPPNSASRLRDRLIELSLLHMDITDITDRYLVFSTGTVQQKAKHYFDEKIESVLSLVGGRSSGVLSEGIKEQPHQSQQLSQSRQDKAAGTDDGTTNTTTHNSISTMSTAVELVYKKINRIRSLLLPNIHKMSLMYCEIESDIDLAQTFMYLQQMSLFSMGALLENPTPGIKFSTADWVRNLCLSCVMHKSIKIQQDWYQQRWLEPLVLRPLVKLNLDVVIHDFLLSEGMSVELEAEISSSSSSSSSFGGLGHRRNTGRSKQQQHGHKPITIKESGSDSCVETELPTTNTQNSFIGKASNLFSGINITSSCLPMPSAAAAALVVSPVKETTTTITTASMSLPQPSPHVKSIKSEESKIQVLSSASVHVHVHVHGHISAMEQSMLSMLKMHHANSAFPAPPKAVTLYSKFVSYIEGMELHRQEVAEKEATKTLMQTTATVSETMPSGHHVCKIIPNQTAHTASATISTPPHDPAVGPKTIDTSILISEDTCDDVLTRLALFVSTYQPIK